MQPASEAIVREYQSQAVAQTSALEAYLALYYSQMVQPGEFSDSFNRFVEFVTPAILSSRQAQANTMRSVLTAVHRIEVPTDRTWIAPSVDVLSGGAEKAAKISLNAVGAAGLVKHLRTVMREKDPDIDYSGLGFLDSTPEDVWRESRAKYGKLTGATGGRIAFTGGRDASTITTLNDQKAIGWLRMTSDDCCSFCALLATRGYALDKGGTSHYRQNSFDDSDARFAGEGSSKVHDNCRCVMVPRFSRDNSDFSAKAEADYGLYLSLPGKGPALQEFRKAYEGRLAVA